MNYYIQGDAAKADKIKAAFEELGYDTKHYTFDNDNLLFYTINGDYIPFLDGRIMREAILINIIKTHPDYKELELPKPHYDIKNFKPFDKVLVRDGAKWADSHPQWYDAKGDNVPEYGREVIVIGRDGKVFFGHRPDPKEVTMVEGKPYHAKTYDKNGWNWPNIALWLDVEVPDELIDKITTEYFKENGQKRDSE